MVTEAHRESEISIPDSVELCGMSLRNYFEAAEKMHGNLAPGLVIGGFMVNLARKMMGKDKICDVIVETGACLPDAVQLLTPCSIGNGWMKIRDVGKYALTMYDKFDGTGVRVTIDCRKLEKYPDFKEWFLKLKPKKEQSKSRIIEDMIRAGESVLSYRYVHVVPENKKSKGTIGICPECGDAYPLKHGLVCIPCQSGGSYYREGEKGAKEEEADVEFLKVPVEEAIGKPLAHDITKIVPGEFKGPEFEKGYVVKAGDLCRLQQLGKGHIYVLEDTDNGFLHEDDAAIELAKNIAGPGVEYDSKPREGKIDFYAARDGLLVVNRRALLEFNLIPEVMCATRHRFTVVNKGEKLAGARAIPLVVKREVIDRAVEVASEAGGLISVVKIRQASAGIIITGNEVFQGLIEDKFEPIIKGKLKVLGSHVKMSEIVPDDSERIADAIDRMIHGGCDLIVTTAGLSVDPDDVTREGVKKAGGRDIVYGSAVLPGAMAMVARIGSVPVVGVPACGLYFKTTIFDLLIPRVLAGFEISRYDLAEMGHGGFCLNCKECKYPKCAFGKV